MTRSKTPKATKPPPQTLRTTTPGEFALLQAAEFGDEVREVLYVREPDGPTRQSFNVPTTRILLLQGEPGKDPRVIRGPSMGRDPGESDGSTIVVGPFNSHWTRLIGRAMLFYEGGGVPYEDEEPPIINFERLVRTHSDNELLTMLLSKPPPSEMSATITEVLRRMNR